MSKSPRPRAVGWLFGVAWFVGKRRHFTTTCPVWKVNRDRVSTIRGAMVGIWHYPPYRGRSDPTHKVVSFYGELARSDALICRPQRVE